jgi:hypothetical protein
MLIPAYRIEPAGGFWLATRLTPPPTSVLIVQVAGLEVLRDGGL